MKIERLDETRLIIALDKEDMKKFDINFESLMWNDEHSRNVIKELLAIAKEKTGFTTESKRLMIEVVPKSSGFVILFTILKEIKKSTRRKYKIIGSGEPFVYMFETAEDLLRAIERLFPLNSKISNSKLLHYKNNYYLIVYTKSGLSISTATILSEYSKLVGTGSVKSAKLGEYGKTIVENNAVNIIGKYIS